MRLYRRSKRGNWHLAFTAPDGRRVRQSTGTSKRKEAQEYADRLKAETWRVHQLGDRPRRSWQEATVRFLAETNHKRTHDDDVAKLRWLHPYLGHLMLDQVSAQVVAEIRDAVLAGKGPGGGTSPGTAAKYLALIRSILRKAVAEWEWLDRAPAVKLPKSRYSNEGFRWLRREQADQLLRALHDASLEHTADMMRLTLATGMRESNVTRLRWDHVDLSRRLIWIDPDQSKSGRATQVPLNKTALAVLRERRFQDRDRVFMYCGKPIRKASTRAWREVLQKQGLRPKPRQHPENFRWHDLRHTWASWHVMSGTPLEVLQRLGGWRSLDMVLRYAHLAPSHVARYAENIENDTKLAQSQDENFGGLSLKHV
ncbi:MAG: site-specific integrase [Pseudomonadota bacterium]